MQKQFPTETKGAPAIVQEGYAPESQLQGNGLQGNPRGNVPVTFEEWMNGREVVSLGTNTGAESLPFQDWCKIKEAFAPELIERAVDENPVPVSRCVDPFGGSGTTGIACQFLGVHPILAEVNPYLADLISAKLTAYPSTKSLLRDLDDVMQASILLDSDRTRQRFRTSPPTLVEPGRKDRWIFNADVACRIDALLSAIESLQDPARRLFRVLLGGILVEVSNVRVTGKGRRYRGGWRDKPAPPDRVGDLFSASVSLAIEQIERFSNRSVNSFDVRLGDSKSSLSDIGPCDLAVFSPPYPNSFDYTDVYNVELWTLGYLKSWQDNLTLRTSTLSSHVQVSRQFADPPDGSSALACVLENLESQRDALWDQRIPNMVGAYFADLLQVLSHLKKVLVDKGTAWIVVGDSSYAGIRVPTAQILYELAQNMEWRQLEIEPLRTMRTSPQQGGDLSLAEQLLKVRK